MKIHYFINGVEVHVNTYNQYMKKEWQRAKINCPKLNAELYSNLYNHYGRIVLNDITFERKLFS